MDVNVSVLYITMVNFLQFEKSKNILEVAIGGGQALPYALLKKNP